jgi:hypothetical protein
MVIRGGVSPGVGRLVAVPTLTTIGRSPRSIVDVRVKYTKSKPGCSELLILPGTKLVVPTTTLAALAAVALTPVTERRSTVGTGLPVLLGVVTSYEDWTIQAPRVSGSCSNVALQTIARPPGPITAGLVKMSGCADTTAMFPRITVPLLLITSG